MDRNPSSAKSPARRPLVTVIAIAWALAVVGSKDLMELADAGRSLVGDDRRERHEDQCERCATELGTPRLYKAGRARPLAWVLRLIAAGAKKALSDRDHTHDQQGLDRGLARVLEPWQLLAQRLRIQAIHRLATRWVSEPPHGESPTWALDLQQMSRNQLDIVPAELARRREEERREREAAADGGRRAREGRRLRRVFAARLRAFRRLAPAVLATARRAFRRLAPAALAEARLGRAFRWHPHDALIVLAEHRQREALEAGRRGAMLRGLIWLEARREAAASAVLAGRRAALRELRAEAWMLQLMATSELKQAVQWLDKVLWDIDLLEQPTPGWTGLDTIKARATGQLERLRADLERRAGGGEITIPPRPLARLRGWVGDRSRGAVSGVRSRRDRALERVRARPLLVIWIVALALGIQTAPGYWWTPIGGFLVDDLGVGLWVPTLLAAAAFGAMGVASLTLGPIARRFDLRRLACWLAMAGALAMALQGLFPVLAVVWAATFAAALTAVGVSLMTPLVLRLSKEGRSGRTFGWFTMGWIATVSAILIAEPFVAHNLAWQIAGWEVAGWRVAAFGQAAVGLLSAPLLLVARSEPERDTRRLREIYRAAWTQLKGRKGAKMRRVVGVMAVSGALFGIFHSTYSPLLRDVGSEHLAFLPASAFAASTLTPGVCGWLFDRVGSPRPLLVTAAAITAAAFAVGLAQVWVPVALVAFVLAVQALLTEVGTTAKSTVAPPAILDGGQSEIQNALLSGPRFLAMSGCAFLAAPLFAVGNPAVTINSLALAVGVLGIVFAARIPLTSTRG